MEDQKLFLCPKCNTSMVVHWNGETKTMSPPLYRATCPECYYETWVSKRLFGIDNGKNK
jgi:hypothetical protein